VKENTSLNCDVIFTSKKLYLTKKSLIPKMKRNVTVIKCMAHIFLKVVSFPSYDDLIIQKCTSVS